MDLDPQILDGSYCPYCGEPTALVDSKLVYRKSYGLIYHCHPCKAWVGVHEGTTKAKGRLANAQLREAKKRAHFFFDQLWRRKMDEQNWPKKKARGAAYKWLGDQLQLEPEYCHIGMMDLATCMRVVVLSKPYCKIKIYPK